MSSQQTRTPSDRSPAGAEPETHWSEDRDFQWRAATELLIAMGVPRSTARLTGDLRTSIAHLEEVDAHLPRDGKPLPEADRLTRNNAVDAVARAVVAAYAREGFTPPAFLDAVPSAPAGRLA